MIAVSRGFGDGRAHDPLCRSFMAVAAAMGSAIKVRWSPFKID